MNRVIYLILSLSFSTWAFSQKKHVVSGTISDGENGETLIGASIYVKEDPAKGTISNSYGFYSLSLPEGTYTLMISFIGLESQSKSINLDGDKRLNFELLPSAQALSEVTIASKKENENITSEKIGIEKLKPSEIKKIPVLMGEQDVVKVLTLTPGIKTSSEGSGGMYVRGGNNSQNLILLDEATVYNSNHMLGFFSTFNSDAIKDLTMYKGTAPAEYGGRVSSVMDIKMNEGNNQKYSLSGGIGLISSKLKLEGPIVKSKGSFLITGRRTYADLFLKFSSDDKLKNNQLYFYDLNLKANYQINENNRIYISGFLGRDVLGVDDKFGLDWGNTTSTIRWNHIWNSRLFSNTSLIYSDYDYNVSIYSASTDYELLSVINNWNLKQDFQYFANDKLKYNFGLYGQHSTITPGQLKVPDNSDIMPPELDDRLSLEYGAFVSQEWKPTKRWTIVGGLRLNMYNLIGPGDFYTYENGQVVDVKNYGSNEMVQSYTNLEPRLNMAFVLNESSSTKLSYTRNTQNLHLIQSSTTSNPTDVWITSSNNIKPEIADQVSLGYFKNLKSNQYQLSAEVYYKWMQNQLDLRDGADINANEHLEGELLFGQGRAYGLEMLAKKKKGKLTGWIAYTLSSTEKQIDGINNGDWYSARQDATHDVSIVAIYNLSKKWNLSAAWVYNTGNAATFPSGKYEVNGNVERYYTERNGYRMPDYHRLDLSVTYNLKKKKMSESSLSLSLYNAYGQKNAYSIDFVEDPDDLSKTIAQKTYLFTFLPSISYNFKF